MYKKVSVMIDEELLKKIDVKSKETLRSRSNFIEYVLREYIKEDEVFRKMER